LSRALQDPLTHLSRAISLSTTRSGWSWFCTISPRAFSLSLVSLKLQTVWMKIFLILT